ncbi:ferrous iron transport protein B [Raineyella antarctica]|uniref:Ferrous iron transport protein B n=1 Tax=Raineyella antarctica TaxID=1577474 RepID=A0A1G6GGQ5_9ACTN|nr:ferrous iron transporter B [Raineyella antarctica]SDB80366.1 ferrous iron transport protein B [Raineyella antarctica]
MSHAHHGGGASVTAEGVSRIALVGSPNSGKSTLFNALSGLHTRTGNYPGVTVARYEGLVQTPAGQVVVEDLPGTYSLDPISPDEKVVEEILDPDDGIHPTPDAVIATVDATTLRRSLGLIAQVLTVGLPTTVIVTFTDELARRNGHLDLAALERALGVPVRAIAAGDPRATDELRAHLDHAAHWGTPLVPPPTAPDEVTGWITSVLDSAGYRVPEVDARTRRIDNVVLHPVWGTILFFVTMFAFFQVIFTVAAPVQGLVQSFFDWLAALAQTYVPIGWLASFLSQGLIGGVGAVVVFLPQIALLFVLISILEGTGYMSRAAFLMDRVMAKAGLEGRAFVALLSSLACAIPGIMATRSLPSAKDRLATMMAAPLMTCSARLPVYVMLISLLVPSEIRLGPFGAQGAVMFLLYLGGAIASMGTAWFFSKVTGRRQGQLPFYMEMPPYRMPKLSTVLHAVWDACAAFLRKMSTVILGATVVMWLLLSLPMPSAQRLQEAGIDRTDQAAVATYTLNHSAAAALGKAIEPVFEPLGFDWRINIGIISSLTARETFVSTMGQVASASDPANPGTALERMTVEHGPRAGEPLFTPPVIASLMVFFMFALQCMATMAVMRRETGTWKWPLIAWGYMFTLAWVFAFLTRLVVGALT